MVVIQAGADMIQNANALDFVRLQYRHCKPILSIASDALLSEAGIPATLPDGSVDPALIVEKDECQTTSLEQFKKALEGHRSFARETPMPRA